MKEACFTKALTVAFSEGVYGKIKSITDQERISMGEWVRLAVEEALAAADHNNILKGENNK